MAYPVTVGICVPTFGSTVIRDFLNSWSPHWEKTARSSSAVRLFVHEDSPHKTFDLKTISRLEVTHTAHPDIARELGSSEWIIPRGTGACRSFPMYLAWKAGCEYIVTLDHD